MPWAIVVNGVPYVNRGCGTFNRIPGLSHIPILGELFKSREKKKTKTELIVMVTPELVEPIDAGAPTPEVIMPVPFLEPFKAGDKLKYDGRLAKEND